LVTTVAVSPELAKELKLLKMEEGLASIDEVIEKMLIEYKKRRFLEASEKFRERMKEKGLKLEDLTK